MFFSRIYYELKIMGKWAVLTPFLVLLVGILMALLLHTLHTDPKRFLMAVVEMLLPLAAGIIVGAIVTQDVTLELHLTVPRRYHLTGLLRLFLVFGAIALLSFLFINALSALHLLFEPTIAKTWSPTYRLFIIQLIWLAPLLWCLAVGFFFALVMQGWTANVALLGGIWIAEIIFKDYIVLDTWLRPILLFPNTLLLFSMLDISQADFNTYVLFTRFALLGTALLLLPLGWLLLRNTERMLKGMVAD